MQERDYVSSCFKVFTDFNNRLFMHSCHTMCSSCSKDQKAKWIGVWIAIDHVANNSDFPKVDFGTTSPYPVNVRWKEHKKIDKVLQVTVDFVSEIITCIRDKEKKIVSGSPDKIKTIYDTWTFSRDMRSKNPNWLLVNTLN